MTFRLNNRIFGTNEKVPDFPDADIIGTAPQKIRIPNQLVSFNKVKDKDVKWDLEFISCSRGFFNPIGGLYTDFTGYDEDVITAWYWEEEKGVGHELSLIPFINTPAFIPEPLGVGPSDNPNITEPEGFVTTTKPFVDFSKVTPPQAITSNQSINTDLMRESSVTATVHKDLSEFEGTIVTDPIPYPNPSFPKYIITEGKWEIIVVFDQIFVYGVGGKKQPGSEITANHGQSCYALAIFNEKVKCIKKPQKEKASGPSPL